MAILGYSNSYLLSPGGGYYLGSYDPKPIPPGPPVKLAEIPYQLFTLSAYGLTSYPDPIYVNYSANAASYTKRYVVNKFGYKKVQSDGAKFGIIKAGSAQYSYSNGIGDSRPYFTSNYWSASTITLNSAAAAGPYKKGDAVYRKGYIISRVIQDRTEAKIYVYVKTDNGDDEICEAVYKLNAATDFVPNNVKIAPLDVFNTQVEFGSEIYECDTFEDALSI